MSLVELLLHPLHQLFEPLLVVYQMLLWQREHEEGQIHEYSWLISYNYYMDYHNYEGKFYPAAHSHVAVTMSENCPFLDSNKYTW